MSEGLITFLVEVLFKLKELRVMVMWLLPDGDKKAPLCSDADPVQELTYDLRSQCDAIRVTKTVRPFSMACCPVRENAAALVVSDGRVMVWELRSAVGHLRARSRSVSRAVPLFSVCLF